MIKRASQRNKIEQKTANITSTEFIQKKTEKGNKKQKELGSVKRRQLSIIKI